MVIVSSTAAAEEEEEEDKLGDFQADPSFQGRYPLFLYVHSGEPTLPRASLPRRGGRTHTLSGLSQNSLAPLVSPSGVALASSQVL